MSDHIEPKQTPAVKAVRTAGKLFSNQALALDQIFNRALKEARPGNFSFHQDMRMALKAQAQYRSTLKILLALEDARKADLSRRLVRRPVLRSSKSEGGMGEGGSCDLSSEARRAKEEAAKAEEKTQNSSKQTNGEGNSPV